MQNYLCSLVAAVLLLVGPPVLGETRNAQLDEQVALATGRKCGDTHDEGQCGSCCNANANVQPLSDAVKARCAAACAATIKTRASKAGAAGLLPYEQEAAVSEEVGKACGNQLPSNTCHRCCSASPKFKALTSQEAKAACYKHCRTQLSERGIPTP